MTCCGNKSDKGSQKSVGKRRVKVQVSSSSAVDKTASESSIAVSKDDSSDDEAPSVPECACTAAVQTEEFLEKVVLANAAVEKKDQGCDACEIPAPCAKDDSDVGACGEDKEMVLKALMMEKALHFLSCNVIQGLNEFEKAELEDMMKKAETGDVCTAECPETTHPTKLDRTPVLKRLGESLDFIEQQELKSVLFLKDIQRKRWSETIEAKAPDVTGCCMEIITE